MGGVRWRRAASACAAALLGAGCSVGGADDRVEPEDPPTTSPLAEIIGWGMATDGTGVAPEVPEVERQRHLQVENLIAECMADHGFEYIPVSLDERRAGPFDEAYALDPEAFAAEYGYGATTLSALPEEQFHDPNQEIIESLSPAEREEYDRALWGEPEVVDPSPEQQGCQLLAAGEVYGWEDPDHVADGMERFADLFDALDALWRQIDADPRLADTDANWVRCMAAAGYPGFERPHDARQSVFDQAAALAAEDEPDSDRVAELRAYELTLAPVDQACREEHLDGPRRAVAYEHEARFVAEHRVELEAYRDWVAGEG